MRVVHPLSFRASLVVAVLFASFTSITAQDFVQLKAGAKLRGEVIKRDDDEIWLVTPDAELKKIPAASIGSIRNTKTLPPAIVERLGDDGLDVKHVYAVAEWAQKKERRLQAVAKRLLRRAVALKPTFEPAREALGHAFFEGTWFTTRKAAFNASKKQMTADGHIYHRGAWIKKELLPFMKGSAVDWMRYRGLYWRLISDVRKERGDKLWMREWYSGRDAKLVRSLKSVYESVQEDIHGAQVGRCRVFAALDRDEVHAIAARHQQASDWFAEAFNLAERDKRLIESPRLDDYIFSGQDAFNRFLERNRGRLGLREPEAFERAKKTESQRHGNLLVQHLGRDAWQWGSVSAVGERLFKRFWAGGDPPAWLWVAVSHHAEIAVMGDVRIQWFRGDSYGTKKDPPELEGRNMAELKEALKEAYSGQPMPGLRALMSKHLHDLDASLELLGTVYVAYLLEAHRDTFLTFIIRTKGTKRDWAKRFEVHFGVSCEAFDKQFQDWLR